MNNKISEEDKRNFSKYVMHGDFDGAEQLLRKLAKSVQFEKKGKFDALDQLSSEGAQRCLISTMRNGENLEHSVRMIQLYPDLFGQTKKEIERATKRAYKEDFYRFIKCGHWDGAQSVLFYSIQSELFKEEKSPLINKETLQEPQQSFICSVRFGNLVACINLLRHRSTLLFEVKEEIENVMKEKKERISANEDTRDSKEFSKYIKCGDWEEAKIILERVAEQSSSEIERPYEQVKEDFAHGVKIRSLPVCAAIMKRYPNIAVDVEEEIKNIMQKNKENNQLNVLDGLNVSSHVSGKSKDI